MNRLAALAACERIIDITRSADAAYAQLLADLESERLAGEALQAKWREQDRQADERCAELHTIDATTQAVLGRVAA